MGRGRGDSGREGEEEGERGCGEGGGRGGGEGMRGGRGKRRGRGMRGERGFTAWEGKCYYTTLFSSLGTLNRLAVQGGGSRILKGGVLFIIRG